MLRIRGALPLILAAVCLVPLCATAQPTIHGSLSGSLGPGIFIVDGNCQVNAGATLTIQPGTTFKFCGHYYFTVYGQLNANGTAQDSILFVRQFPNETCKHGGIRFVSGSSPSSSLSYCLIDNARNYTYPNYDGGGIYVQNVGVTISHCRLSNSFASSGGGLYATGAGGLTVTDCIFFGNEAGNGGGLYLNNCSNAVVQHSVFGKNTSTST